MAVYFKFKSAKDFDSVSIDGHFISVANLKEKIVEQKKLGRGSDYDLVISNAQTNEEYTDEGFLVPKNTSVIVRRVPGRPSLPIVTDVKDERKSTGEVLAVKSGFQILEPTQKNTLQSTPSDGLDDFGVDLYAVPEVVQASTTSMTEDEDNKIKAFVDASANDWQRQTQESFAAGRGYGNKGQGRGLPSRGYGRGFEKKNPPHGYVCHRCGVTGHYIQHCPTNGDPTYDIKKVKPPTGIPKTMLVANPDGSYALPTGEVAVLKPNEAVFEREIDGLPSTSRPMLDIPHELCCPLCKGVLKEAVLTSKCCFKSYCDKCIRNEIILKAKCVCGATNILADDLLPNRTLRDAISRFLESQASAATSSGNVGSRAHLPDMESTPYARSKVPSPAVSVSLKEASSVLVASDGSDTNEKFAGAKDSSQIQAEGPARQASKTENASGKRPPKDGASTPAKQAVEVVDGSPESQLTKDGGQEILSSERPVRVDTESREQLSLPLTAAVDQGPSEPVKGRKKPKNKRSRQADMPYADGMWSQGPNYNPQAENCCMNCGSFEHPSWNCYMNGPGPSHHPPSMQGPMFGPGFNPPMRGMMHQPMGDGYMMPYHHNPGPYNPYGFAPYEMHFNGPMVPPHEAFAPHPGMMPYGPPIQRDYIDPNLMSRDEFEARKAELKRRKEREQRFGREQVKYPSTDVEMDTGRLNGRVGHRIIPIREREGSPDLPDEHVPRARSYWNGESGAKVSRSREEWIDKDEVRCSSDGEGSAGQDYHIGKSHEKLSSRQVDEASSDEEVSREGRYSKGEMEYMSKRRERGFAHNKANGDAIVEVARSSQRRTASGYDSDDGDLRRLSGSQVGPSSPSRIGNAVLDEQFSREIVDRRKDNNGNRRQEVDRFGKVGNSREGPRGSVFDRTNLPIKPRRTRTADEEHDKINEREFRVKRIKGTGNRQSGGREQVGERVRDSEDGSWQHSSANASRKRRMTEDMM